MQKKHSHLLNQNNIIRHINDQIVELKKSKYCCDGSKLKKSLLITIINKKCIFAVQETNYRLHPTRIRGLKMKKLLIVLFAMVYTAAYAQTYTTLGIGTSPIGTLHVHSATGNDWPDYVFDNSYTLPSLEQTEEYIKDNGHLPGVPSAKEIEEQGLNLGEMNKILMQKVEELTLQVIELNKQIKELKGE